MEALLGLTVFGSIWGAVGILGVLLIALLIFEYKSNIWGVIVSVGLFILVNYKFGNIPLNELFSWWTALTYFVVGFGYSMLRTWLKGKELKTANEKRDFDLKSAVFTWWFLFPLSMINLIVGKGLVKLYGIVFDKLKGTYEKLFYQSTLEDEAKDKERKEQVERNKKEINVKLDNLVPMFIEQNGLNVKDISIIKEWLDENLEVDYIGEDLEYVTTLFTAKYSRVVRDKNLKNQKLVNG